MFYNRLALPHVGRVSASVILIMTRRPITPIKERGQFLPNRNIDPNEKLEETITMVGLAVVFYPIFWIAHLLGIQRAVEVKMRCFGCDVEKDTEEK